MLTGPLLLPPLFLAGLLALSGAVKVRHVEATRSAFTQLRMPPGLTSSAAPRALPWAEILLAFALVLAPQPLAVPVAVLALILCLGYLAVIVRALGFDHPVTCGCFGELRLGEVTGRTPARNALLVLLASLTLWSASAEAAPGARLLAAPATTWAWLAVTIVSGAILLATFGEAKGASRPLRDLGARGALLLVFVSPGCSPCAETISAIADWTRRWRRCGCAP